MTISAAKRALIIRHVDYEGAAGYREPIVAAGYGLEWLAADSADFSGDVLDTPDLLVVMGGPMGVYDTDAHPWIMPEIAAIGRRLAKGLPTLGICLGSQMVASALGARVYPGPVLEVGFSTLTLSEAGLASPVAAVADVPVLHWHGDTFDLPTGATLLASTEAFPQQAFSVGRRVLALQFHAEMGEDPRFDIWIGEGRDYVAAAGVDADRLIEDHRRLGPGAVAAGRVMIAQWLDALGH